MLLCLHEINNKWMEAVEWLEVFGKEFIQRVSTISVFKTFVLWCIIDHLSEPKCSIFREPRKELGEPLGPAEPGLKNTGLFVWTCLV